MLCPTCRRSLETAVKVAMDEQPGFDPVFNRLSPHHRRDELVYHDDSYMLHESSINFCEGSAAGCFVCHLIWTNEEMRASIDKQTQSTSSLNQPPVTLEVDLFEESDPHCGLSVKNAVFNKISLSPGSGLQSRGVLSSIGLNATTRSTCTSGTVDLWRYWYQTCTKSHIQCQRNQARLQQFTPTRLIEILEPECSSNDHLRWRLVQHTDTGHVPYVTLSHCWGSSRHSILTKANFSDLLSHISSCSALPKTYNDALVIAHSLGFRHIWIDSLCIVQDDESDWLSESSTMDKVYRNSCCNIAATWADDGENGCFSKRDPVDTALATITVTHKSGMTTEYQLGDTWAWRKDIDDAPLNSRGWVFQERYLSQRQMQFANSQVYWECSQLVASEQFPAGLPEDMFTHKTSKPSLTKVKIGHAWLDLVQRYSKCELTRPSDKAIALAGLASHMGSSTSDEYLAGLWRRDLERQLCWNSVMEHRSESRLLSTGEFYVPSWSWMSARGPVEYDFRYGLHRQGSIYLGAGGSYGLNDTDTAEILDVEIQSNHPSKLHSFLSCELRIRGVALWGRDIGHIPAPRFGFRTGGEAKSYQFRVDYEFPVSRRDSENAGAASAFNAADAPGFHDVSAEQPRQENTRSGASVRDDAYTGDIWGDSIASGDDDIIVVKWDTIASADTGQTPRPAELLFLVVYIHQENARTVPVMSCARGLVLKQLEGEKTGIYTREGIFYYFGHGFGHRSSRPLCDLAVSIYQRSTEEDRALGRISFGDPEISKLLKTVTIV